MTRTLSGLTVSRVGPLRIRLTNCNSAWNLQIAQVLHGEVNERDEGEVVARDRLSDPNTVPMIKS